MSSSRKAALFAVLLVIALIALLMRKPPAGETSTAAATARHPRPASTAGAETTRRSAAPRASQDAASEIPDTPEARHFRNFYLRPTNFNTSLGLQVHGVVHLSEPASTTTLAQAVDWVKAEYAAIARDTGVTALPLEIDLSAADPTRPVAIRLPRLPVTAALGLIAAATGNRLQGSGPAFALVATPETSSNEPFGWNPASLEPFAFGPEGVNFRNHENDSCLNLGKAKLAAAPTEITRPDLVQALRDLGMPLSEGLSVSQSNEDGRMWSTVEHATASDLALLHGALEVLQADLGVSQQAKVSTTIVELPADAIRHEFAAGDLDDAGYESMLQRLSSVEGATLTTLPSVVSRFGQVSTIDIQGDASREASPRNGVSLTFLYRPLGLGSENTFDFAQTPPAAEAGSAGEPLVQLSGETSTPDNGRTYITGRATDGRQVILIRTTQRIDATGRPIQWADAP